MIIGVPKEIKPDEYRVAVTPAGVEQLWRNGHTILVQRGAGVGSGIPDEDYQAYGAQIVETAQEVFEEADLICKVKESLAQETAMIRERHVDFAYFHFAASRELTERVLQTGCVAIAYETIEDIRGRLLRNDPPDDARPAHLCRGQRGALWRNQHARGRRAGQHVRPDQCYDAVSAEAGQHGLPSGLCGGPRVGAGCEHAARAGHLPPRGRSLRHVLYAVVGGKIIRGEQESPPGRRRRRRQRGGL